MESDPIDTETVGEINQAGEDANAPPPETLIVKMRGRPAGSKNKGKIRQLSQHQIRCILH